MESTCHSDFGGFSRCKIIKNKPLSQNKIVDRQGLSHGHWGINILA